MTEYERDLLAWLHAEVMTHSRTIVGFPFVPRSGIFQLENGIACKCVVLFFKYQAFEKETGKEVFEHILLPDAFFEQKRRMIPLRGTIKRHIYEYYQIEYQPDHGYNIRLSPLTENSEYLVSCVPYPEAGIGTIDAYGDPILMTVNIKEAVNVLKTYSNQFFYQANYPVSEKAPFIVADLSECIEKADFRMEKPANMQDLFEFQEEFDTALPESILDYYTFSDGTDFYADDPEKAFQIYNHNLLFLGKAGAVVKKYGFQETCWIIGESSNNLYILNPEQNDSIAEYNTELKQTTRSWVCLTEWLCDMLGEREENQYTKRQLFNALNLTHNEVVDNTAGGFVVTPSIPNS